MSLMPVSELPRKLMYGNFGGNSFHALPYVDRYILNTFVMVVFIIIFVILVFILVEIEFFVNHVFIHVYIYMK